MEPTTLADDPLVGTPVEGAFPDCVIPSGYRRLAAGELVQESDLWPHTMDLTWCYSVRCGSPCTSPECYIRRIDPATPPPPCPAPPCPATPPPLSTHFPDSAVVSFITNHPDHPMVRAVMSRHAGSLPNPVPTTAEGWAAWLAVTPRSVAKHTPSGLTTVGHINTRARRGPVVNFTITSTESGTATYACRHNEEWHVTIPDEVLEEASESGDEYVILEWVRQYGTSEGHQDDVNNDNYEYNNESMEDTEYEETAVSSSDISDAFEVALSQYPQD